MNDCQALVKVDDLRTLGGVLAKSGYFQDAKEEAQAVVKVLAGQELGLGPIASMTGIYIVKGRVTLSANLIGATIKRSGKYDYQVVKLDNRGCTLKFFERVGGERCELGESTFTDEDAKAAGLGGDNWSKFRRNMHFARAMSNGAKWFCPDVFAGPIYTPDEVGATVDGETGEIIDAEATIVEPERSSPPSPAPQTAPKSNGQPSNGRAQYTSIRRPWEPDLLIAKLQTAAEKPFAGTHSDGMKGSTVGWLDEICGGADRWHTLIKVLFGKPSSKQLSESEWEALDIWRRVGEDGLFRKTNGQDIAVETCRDEANRAINREVQAAAVGALPGMEA